MLMGQRLERFVLITQILQVFILPEAPAFLIRCGKRLAKTPNYTNHTRELLVKPVVKILFLFIKVQMWMLSLLLYAEARLNTRGKSAQPHRGHIFPQTLLLRLRRN